MNHGAALSLEIAPQCKATLWHWGPLPACQSKEGSKGRGMGTASRRTEHLSCPIVTRRTLASR